MNRDAGSRRGATVESKRLASTKTLGSFDVVNTKEGDQSSKINFGSQEISQPPQTADQTNRYIRVPGIEYQEEYLKFTN